jgi:WD40 repeat protein/serine/threonine protein kinase
MPVPGEIEGEAAPSVDTAPTIADGRDPRGEWLPGSTPASERRDSTPSQPQLHEYRLVRQLGRGGMGTVWLAHDLNLDRLVALKTIRRTGHPDQDERFLTEARAIARLRHPNVIQIHRIGEWEGQSYIVTEYLRGASLDRLELPLEIDSVLNIAVQLARGLAAAHRQGVLHRDIKPGNVFLCEGGEVKLLDFGIAKLVRGEEAPASAPPEPLTETDRRTITTATKAGALMGTPAYLAPECCSGQPATTESDVYSFGATLYQLVTGKLPHRGATIIEYVFAAATKDAPKLKDVRPEIPASLAELVDRCLKREAKDRPANAEVLREALESITHRQRAGALPEGTPYRGLQSFEEAHAALFFGRDSETAALVDRLTSQPWVVITARSGTGKSSLVRAGVLPRFVQEVRDGPSWNVLTMLPSQRPFSMLIQLLAPALNTTEPDLRQTAETSPADVARELRDPGRRKTLLFIDQLEEIFTLSSEEERELFVALLEHLVSPSSSIRLISTIRSDFLGHFDRVSSLREAFARSLYLLAPMDEQDLRAAIVSPAKLLGFEFEQPEDVSALLRSASSVEAGLPLLEFALAQLWEMRDPVKRVIPHDALDRVGGVEGALVRHADEVLGALSPAARKEARSILLHLVSGSRTRVRKTAKDLLDAALERREVVQATLDALVRGRLLVTGEAEGEGTYEIVHEALITRWDRLRLWLEEEGETQMVRDRLELDAADWDRMGRLDEMLWRGRQLLQLDLLEGQPIGSVAREFAAAARAVARRVSRRRILAVSTVIALLSAATFVSVQGKREADEQRGEAVLRRAEALAESARAARTRGDLIEARAKLRASLETQDSPQSRILWQELRDTSLLWSKPVGGYVYSIAFSPSGDRIAVAVDRAIQLYDLATGDRRTLHGGVEHFNGVAFAPSGSAVAAGSRNGEIWLWEPKSGSFLQKWNGHDGEVTSVAFSAKGTILASGGTDRRVRIWSLDGRMIEELRTDDPVISVDLDREERLVAAASGSEIALWDLQTGARVRTFEGHEDGATAVRFVPNGRTLVSAGRDGAVFAWSVDGDQPRTIAKGGGLIWDLRVSPDGARVAAAGVSRRVQIFDLVSAALVHQIEGHEDEIYGLGFGPSGRVIASGGLDRTLRLWRLDRRQDPPEGHTSAGHTIEVGSKRPIVATIGLDHSIRIWDLHTAAQLSVIHDSGLAPSNIDVSPDDTAVAASRSNGSIAIWDISSGRELNVLEGLSGKVHGVVFSPAGGRLVGGGSDGTIAVWELPSGRRLRMFRGHASEISDVEITGDGKLLASGGADAVVRLWDLESGRLLRTLEGHSDYIYSLSFAPNAKWLVSASLDGTVRRWDLASGQGEILGSAPRVHQVAVHPSGELVAAAGAAGAVHFWSLSKDKERQVHARSNDEVNCVRFTPDGKDLVAVGDDGVVRKWDVATLEPSWRAPLVIDEPLAALTHSGWRSLTEHSEAPRVPEWAKKIEGAVRKAAIAETHACVLTPSGAVEVWSKPAGDRLYAKSDINAEGVVALRSSSCGALAGGKAIIVSAKGGSTELGPDQVSAIAPGRAGMLVAAGQDLIDFDLAGKELSRFQVGLGVTAIMASQSGSTIYAGHESGAIEAHTNGALRAFEDTPASAVLTLHEAPGDLIAAGYANGDFGLWDRSGRRLYANRAHGGISHILSRSGVLYFVSELGRISRLDLQILDRPRCDVLGELWGDVPIAWESGRAVLLEPPENHACRR